MTNLNLPWRLIQEPPKPGIIQVWSAYGDEVEFETHVVETLPFEFGATAQRWLQLYEDDPDPFEEWWNSNGYTMPIRKDTSRIIWDAARKAAQ